MELITTVKSFTELAIVRQAPTFATKFEVTDIYKHLMELITTVKKFYSMGSPLVHSLKYQTNAEVTDSDKRTSLPRVKQSILNCPTLARITSLRRLYTQHNGIQHNDTPHNDIQHNNK